MWGWNREGAVSIRNLTLLLRRWTGQPRVLCVVVAALSAEVLDLRTWRRVISSPEITLAPPEVTLSSSPLSSAWYNTDS